MRKKFTGTADKVVNLITFYAQEVREVLASLGLRSMDEAIGRADMLAQVSRGNDYLDDLDLNPMLVTVDGAEEINYDRDRPRQSVPDTLDAAILKDAEPFFKHGERGGLEGLARLPLHRRLQWRYHVSTQPSLLRGPVACTQASLVGS